MAAEEEDVAELYVGQDDGPVTKKELWGWLVRTLPIVADVSHP